jgi:hypothetical protein
MTDALETVLLLALPASGKSEVRKYLDQLSPEECRSDFYMGPTVQLDDFPYVHVMRRIDDELAAMGKERLFFQSDDKPFRRTEDWCTLIELINEDYTDMLDRKQFHPESAAGLLLERIDAASKKAKAPARMAGLDDQTRSTLMQKLEKEAGEMLAEKVANYPDNLNGKTLVIEFARGGPQGSDMPLPAYYGYRHSLSQLSEQILEKSTILYIWVTPEESRRKNDARADPDDPGSILHHGVPIDVMLGDYGCDDMDWLEENAEKPGTVKVEAHGKTYHLPVARFDNRVDKTSFIRNDVGQWKKEEVEAIHKGLKSALDRLAELALKD